MVCNIVQKLLADPQSRDLHYEMLKINPDFLPSWDYLKSIALSEEEIQSQYTLSVQILSKHPKSYSGWYHRKFLNEKVNTDLRVEKDRTLIEYTLFLDSRNSSSWDYLKTLKCEVLINEISLRHFISDRSNYSAEFNIKDKVLKISDDFYCELQELNSEYIEFVSESTIRLLNP